MFHLFVQLKWIFLSGGYIFNTEAHAIDPAALEVLLFHFTIMIYQLM